MFENITGQEHIKERLEILIEYSKMKNDRLPDLFFAGPGGTGKSTLSREVIKNLNWAVEGNPAYAELNAASVKSMEQLLNYLFISGIPVKVDSTNKVVEIPRVIVFIDEAQKLKEPLKTELLNAMDECRKTSFKIAKSDVFSASFENVTFIMASTDKNDLSDAFLSRFQIFELNCYTPFEIGQALQKRTAWPFEACLEIGKRAKSVMRTAILDIKNIEAYLAVKNLEPSKENMAKYFTDLKKVDSIGLDSIDYEILYTLKQSDCPIGLKAIALRLSRSENEIESREGFMSSQGLIDKVSNGRIISEEGIKLLENRGLLTTVK